MDWELCDGYKEHLSDGERGGGMRETKHTGVQIVARFSLLSEF
jgi:hypothetical protein